jgi:hypothetical protein
VRDIVMVECGEDLSLAREPREPIAISSDKLGQNLQRDIAIERHVAGAIDLAHAARTDEREDFVRTEARAGGKSHLSRRMILPRRRGRAWDYASFMKGYR